MSEAKFTGGNWWVNPVGQHFNNPDIASLEVCWSEDGECVLDHVYRIEDAHLIAAAPEMYEMLNFLQENPSELNVITVRKLLAKARGEAE